MNENTVRTPECQCPQCGYKLDAATSMSSESTSPKPDDLSVCLSCSAALVFNEDLTLRLLSQEEAGELPIDTQVELVEGIVAVKRFIATQAALN